MRINILEYLDETALRLPTKTAFSDGTDALTFEELRLRARSVGTALRRDGYQKEPVVVFISKHPKTIAAFFGVVYSGNYYVPLDAEMPVYRIEMIMQNLKPRAAICTANTRGILESFSACALYDFETLCETPPDDDILDDVRREAIDADPLYIVYTSGSTGVPKGVVASHRCVLDYVEQLAAVLRFDADTVFGSQTPLYVDACLKELLPTIMFGATTYLIPKSLFRFPLELIDFLNTHKINTVCWVVSALTFISGLGALDKKKPEYLRTVAFGSEVFPVKQFNLWREALPNARFINLYGPTEATGMSCYYEVNRAFEPGEMLPAGKPFRNRGILLLDEHDRAPEPGGVGEICIRGNALALGYFGDTDKTNAAFTQNPLTGGAYRDLIYRTGDIGRFNEYGELVFVSRKDHQIKHMGHRIELGEIEAAAGTLAGIQQACCVYDAGRGAIGLFYAGDAAPAQIAADLRKKMPRYMVPNRIVPVDMMPLTPNGKIDRVALTKLLAN